MTVVAGVVALLALAVTAASLIWLHLAPTGLSPVGNAVSQYGITPFKLGYRVATIAFAVAGAALAAGLARAVGTDSNAGLVIALLVVFASARAAISWFPMDAPHTPRTQTGAVHGLLAVAAFITIGLAALRLGAVLRSTHHWHSLAPISTGLGWAMTAILVTMLAARSVPFLAARFGAVERGFYALALAWSVVFALACVS